MLLFLMSYLDQLGYDFQRVFGYYSTRIILSSLTALAISIFLGPFFIRRLYSLKIGQPIRKDECPMLGELHKKKENTPTMGGVLMLFSILISGFLWMDLTHAFSLILIITTIFLGLVGGYDDYLKLKYRNSKGLSSRYKFLLQSVLALFLASYLLLPFVSQFLLDLIPHTIPQARAWGGDGTVSLNMVEYISRIYIPFMKNPIVILAGWKMIFMLVLILLVLVGTSNAVNLTDGLDGLAAGHLFMVSLVMAIFAFISNNIEIAKYLNLLYIEGSGEIAIYLGAMAGACLGFLWYNGYPAQLFMGDTGSLALGGILGVSAILLRREVLLALVGGIFVMEALSVIIQVFSFKVFKRRVFLCSPIHHHFEYKGWHELKVVLRFWIIGFLLAIIGVASLKFQ